MKVSYGALLLVVFGVHASAALACPKVGEFIDMNCDQALKFVFTGDSIAAGKYDWAHGGWGGYPLRIGERYPEATVVNLGFSGITSHKLYSDFALALNSPVRSRIKRKVRGADLVMIDVGRNDWWTNASAGTVVLNIARLVKLFRDYFKNADGSVPLLLVATLIPTTRSGQRSYVQSINDSLLKYQSADIPAYVRFDRMPSDLLGWDGLHPGSGGYDWLARTAQRFLTSDGQVMCAKARPDRDSDGIYDLFEKIKYHTRPRLRDTDGDAWGDGDEVFVLHTDPLNPFDPPPATATPSPSPSAAPTPTP